MYYTLPQHFIQPVTLYTTSLPNSKLKKLKKFLRLMAAPHSLMMYSTGLARTGGIAIWLQLTCLTVGVAPTLFLTTSRQMGTLLLTWALVCSRLGLWLFDLCVSQMLQEWVPQDQLGK